MSNQLCKGMPFATCVPPSLCLLHSQLLHSADADLFDLGVEMLCSLIEHRKFLPSAAAVPSSQVYPTLFSRYRQCILGLVPHLGSGINFA